MFKAEIKSQQDEDICILIKVENHSFNNIVIYEFDNLDSANKWYYEESSKDVKKLRQAITEGWVTIVEGYNQMNFKFT